MLGTKEPITNVQQQNSAGDPIAPPKRDSDGWAPSNWGKAPSFIITALCFGLAALAIISIDLSFQLPNKLEQMQTETDNRLKQMQGEINDPAHGLKEIKSEVKNTEEGFSDFSTSIDPLFVRDDENKTLAIKASAIPKKETIVIYQGPIEFTYSIETHTWISNRIENRSNDIGEYRTLSLLGSFIVDNESKSLIQTESEGSVPVLLHLIFTDPETSSNVTDVTFIGSSSPIIDPVYAPKLQVALSPDWMPVLNQDSATVRGKLVISIYLSS